MIKKIIVGGLIGAVIVFIVSSIWHVATGLGEVGVKTLPGNGAIEAAMRSSITEPGLYLFPGMADQKGLSKEQRADAQAKYMTQYAQGPTGILVYTPGGTPLEFGKLLANQFIFNVVAALLIAWILAIVVRATTFRERALIVLLIGIAAGVIYALPQWNWYNFPMDYTIAAMASWVISWGIAGLGMAAIIKP
ncbi:MAG TPA: hypothetical protein VEJ39_10090 [Candidatus Acidoferrales bacterium]|nr:hypothetical protein [Candidatus Acidoferrales bacterium]